MRGDRRDGGFFHGRGIFGRSGRSGGGVTRDAGPGGSETGGPPADFALLEGYWEALRAGGGVPARVAVEPRAIARILDRTVLLERIAPGVARVRLGGLTLVDLMGMDLRGMPFTALVAPESRAATAEAVEQVFAGPVAAELAFEGERGIGRPALSVRLLLLPLTGQTGAVDRAIGVFVLSGEIGRTPRRFVLATARHRAIPGVTRSFALPAPVAGGMAEAAADWTPAPLPVRQKPPAAPTPAAPAQAAPAPAAPAQGRAARRAPHLRVVWSSPEPAPQRG
jgi:hypothetical protein